MTSKHTSSNPLNNTDLDKTYHPQSIETRWYQKWESNGYFAPTGEGKPYCIMIPPPNVTGNLHMGHGFGSTLMDVLIRYHRMIGDNTLWQPGTDHAGIATQMVVERQLNAQGLTKHDLGREAFLDKVWDWKKESGGNIFQQFRRLGDSMDWPREKFTMDESLSRAVQEVFIRLYEEGLIYRGTRLVNWDPKLLTAISDLEVISTEEEGHLWHLRYPIVGSDEFFIVATTRPETLLGDVAIAVHPDDERYQSFIGKLVKLPLTNREIPIIADDFVDPAFGSGCVKITPAHDFNDYAVGKRHHLAPINIFTPNAHINENAPAQYQGLERFTARKKILADLEALGLLEKIEKHISKIPRGERSDVIVEPYLTQQWFMDMKPLAAPAIAAVENGDIKFIPENWSKTYFQWMNNIEDWCISRQLWWGHRIPAWFDAQGNIYVGKSEEEVRSKHQLSTETVLHQDNDVLDTWFSSALWPFSTLGWPDKTPDLETFYPTSVLVTGFDIIFFWVARMIMMGLKFTDQVPFKEVYITGLICDANGKKMSKSKGNGLDPLDLVDGIAIDGLVAKRTTGLMQPGMAEKIERNTRKEYPEGINPYGTDALRFMYCAIATYGREIRFDLARLEGYRNFCNKLWNASRYALMNTQGHNNGVNSTDLILSLPDRWMLSRLQKTIITVEQSLKDYRFDLMAQHLYEFVWNQFCDWYLELTKPILMGADYSDAEKCGTRHTLLYVLESILRLMHPIMPFITEEIWQRIAPLAGISGSTIMLQPYPSMQTDLQDNAAETKLEWIQQLITDVRTIRSEMNIAPGKLLPILFNKGTSDDREWFEQNAHLITTIGRFESAIWLNPHEAIPESATALVGELEILIPMAGLIDKKEESARLNREIIKFTKECERAESKLNNPSFVDKAPADVVAKETEKLVENKKTLEKLQLQLSKIMQM